MELKLNKEKWTVNSIVDGPGLRVTLWLQGCEHNCKGCHNPLTHDINNKDETVIYNIDDLAKELNKYSLEHDGLTISGGEPLLQAKALKALLDRLEFKNIWLYSGFVYEHIIDNQEMLETIESIDVLVDGPFVEKEKSVDLYFKGSKNQRVIDVQKSLEKDKIILYKK